MAELSQGWSKHINAVAVAAVQIIHENGGDTHLDLLQSAIAMARESKDDYCASRLDVCSEHPKVYKRLALAAKDRGGVLSCNEIHDLIGHIRSRKGLSTDDFLTNAVHAGVLMEIYNQPKDYKVPIPSFGDYLRDLPHNVPPDMNSS